MAKVSVCNVKVLNNPGLFLSGFDLEITFECVESLPDDLEWKLIYVGSAESEEFDQTLDTVYVGPVPEGRHKFKFEAPAPDATKIPKSDIVGVTVILLTCGYKGAEFLRVGYYVSNEYDNPEMVENPPETPDFDHLQRNILASNPRVTKFKINWEDGTSTGETETMATDAEAKEMGEQGPTTSAMTRSEAMSSGCSDAVVKALGLENIPPCPLNALPQFKDPALQVSPSKTGIARFRPPPPDDDVSADMDLD